MKPVCNVMVGLPGLGKSTLAESFGGFVYSTDAFIEERAKQLNVSYDQIFNESVLEATSYMDDMLGISTYYHTDIVCDQPNLTRKKRRRIINKVKHHGYTMNVNVVIPPEPGHIDDQKVWKNRLLNRPGKIIPLDVIEKMANSFEMPMLEEGFDTIRTFNMYGVLLKNE